MFLAAAGSALTSSDTVLIVLRIFFGICISFLTTVSMAMVVDYMPGDKATEGFGILTMIQVSTFSIGPMISLTIASVWGYSSSIWVASAFALCAVFPLYFLRYDSAARPKHKVTVKQLALSIFAKEALPYMLIMIAITTISSIENNYLALYAKQFRISNASIYFFISAVVLITIRLFFSRYVDRLRFRTILLASTAMITAAFALLGFLSAGNAMALIVIAAILKAAAVSILRPIVQSKCINAAPANRKGAASSTMLLGVDAAFGFTPLISGGIYPVYGYRGVFLYCLIPVIMAAALFAVWHLLQTRGKSLHAS